MRSSDSTPSIHPELPGKGVERDFTDHWLTRWEVLIPSRRPVLILDIGCGTGVDSRYLSQRGYDTIGMDISMNALSVCKTKQPDRLFLQVDLNDKLPFRPNCFDVIVANLSLHFFTDEKTKKVMAEVRNCLKYRGWLFTRLNSTKDIHPRIAREPEIEPNLYQTGDIQKRFYTEQMVVDLFQSGWRVEFIEEIFAYRKGKPKLVWEAIVQKITG